MTTIQADPKRSASTEDFQLDWSLVVGPDAITASTWTVTPPDIAMVTNSFTATTATVRLGGGGLAGHTYLVENVITCTSGISQVQDLEVPVS
jgi:hypothetical protein